MNTSYQTFVSQLGAAVEAYPKLSIVEENGEKFLRGTFDVVDDDGRFWESHEIEIRWQQGFPNCFPKLFEIGGKIHRIADWHTYTDGSCCITIPPKEILLCRNGITVLDFIHEHVRPHLFNQTHRRIEGYYANGEFKHDVEGFWQFYEQELKTTDRVKIVKTLHAAIKKEKSSKQGPCFCGSGKPYEKCHRQTVIWLRQLGREYLAMEIGRLLASLKAGYCP
ncbi:MAG: SEC-C domain-containing protein [Saprospiraceae bacterium]|nr:SEC-C domain-containing protein [Saprospiraceae bacterium]